MFRRCLRVPGEGLKLGAGPDGGPGAPDLERPVHAALADPGEVAGHARHPAATSAHSSALQGPPDAGHTGMGAEACVTGGLDLVGG